jgi:hypothetical protein
MQLSNELVSTEVLKADGAETCALVMTVTYTCITHLFYLQLCFDFTIPNTR